MDAMDLGSSPSLAYSYCSLRALLMSAAWPEAYWITQKCLACFGSAPTGLRSFGLALPLPMRCPGLPNVRQGVPGGTQAYQGAPKGHPWISSPTLGLGTNLPADLDLGPKLVWSELAAHSGFGNPTNSFGKTSLSQTTLDPAIVDAADWTDSRTSERFWGHLIPGELRCWGRANPG